ncbi:hypothetical protein, partial [Bacteroides ovatus]|uniref:hypothetical protein n=1 Tax=Bacteroides ovatus TaxID=28116 RepID=UPI001C01471D
NSYHSFKNKKEKPSAKKEDGNEENECEFGANNCTCGVINSTKKHLSKPKPSSSTRNYLGKPQPCNSPLGHHACSGLWFSTSVPQQR